MSEFIQYRHRHVLEAQRQEESGYIFTANGKEWADEGDYLVRGPSGVFLLPADLFEHDFEIVPEDVTEARKFTPDGKLIPEVLEFLKANPEEVGRVKQLERDGGSRKGILDYEV